MAKKKEKYASGSAKVYISRSQALKKLQLSLRQFRRLCILKGIHPHEPKHIRRVNKGSTERKTFYFTKDIQYLATEPILRKLREQSAFFKKLKRAKTLREHDDIDRLKANAPSVKLDHVVKERYPTLNDACRDLDDALCLLFIFARLPSNRTAVPPKISKACLRLTNEFLHYVIETRSLRKCFVSIKGIYYQAEIQGENVTWIVPHERPFQQSESVDFKLMTIFIEFYIAMLGFVNFALYSKARLVFPPKISIVGRFEQQNDLLLSLLYSIDKKDSGILYEKPAEIDEFEDAETTDDPGLHAARVQQKLDLKLPTLFKNLFFYAQRETPMQSLTFVIRSCGGQVVTDSSSQIDQSKITHQIVDRPLGKMQLLSRVYIQPQWVYDCVNARNLLPTDQYAPGISLPAHLSPFVNEQPGDYVPQEKLDLLRRQGLEFSARQLEEGLAGDEKQLIASKRRKTPKDQVDIKTENVISKKEDALDQDVPIKRKNKTAHKIQQQLNQIGEYRKLQETMMAKKHKRVYKKLVRGEKRKRQKNRALIEKRQMKPTP